MEIVGSNPIGVASRTRSRGERDAVKRALKPLILVLSFIDGVIASVVRPHRLRSRMLDRLDATGAPPPDRCPPRR